MPSFAANRDDARVATVVTYICFKFSGNEQIWHSTPASRFQLLTVAWRIPNDPIITKVQSHLLDPVPHTGCVSADMRIGKCLDAGIFRIDLTRVLSAK
jgi:hypothetical protein